MKYNCSEDTTMILVKSEMSLIEIEVDIINSDPYFNLISKGKNRMTKEEVLYEIAESNEIGAERYLLRDGNKYIGIVEYLMRNPNDGYAWLGLLLIKKEYQAKGFGLKALTMFYDIMKSRDVDIFRIGVIKENDPAHSFWKSQGFVYKSSAIYKDDKIIFIYEKTLF